jgi:lysophospholipase L1-like esterase
MMLQKYVTNRSSFNRRTLFCAALFLGATAGLQAQDDPRPVVDDSKVASESAARKDLPTLFIVGDSTLKSNAPLRGWGQEIGTFFDTTKINVVNRAIGGRSSRTFLAEGRWDAVLKELKTGDYVLIQFGHNDAGKYDDPAAKGRPSLHGDGEETATVTRADGTKETVHTFGWYLRKYGTDAKAKGATAIFCSMVPHKDWKDGKIRRGERDSFVKWTADAARNSGALFIDLNEIIARGYEKLGESAVEGFFGDKRTHYNIAGAKFSAAAVISGLKALHPDPLGKYYSKAAEAVTPAILGR